VNKNYKELIISPGISDIPEYFPNLEKDIERGEREIRNNQIYPLDEVLAEFEQK